MDTRVEGLPLIHVDEVSFAFTDKANTKAVDNVSFGIEKGKITAIIGSSGSGKSTLLKLIFGLLEPETGDVRYDGWHVPTRKDKLIPGHDAMRMVSQNFEDLNTYAKAWDNVASRLSNTDLAAKKSKTEAILKALAISHRAQHRVADLSGGEKQRVAIARALVDEPDVLLLDEPFNQVDAAFRESLQQDIKRIVRETGLTVILVSHDPAEVLAMADHLLVMHEGILIANGEPHALYHQPKDPYTARLLAKSNILSPEEAIVLGINTQKPIAIHPDWCDIDPHTDDFLLADIRYKGFYEELLFQKGMLNMWVINLHPGHYTVNQPLGIHIKRYVELD